jgi:hypothetical protein
MRHTKKTKVVDNFMKNHLTNFLSYKHFLRKLLIYLFSGELFYREEITAILNFQILKIGAYM